MIVISDSKSAADSHNSAVTTFSKGILESLHELSIGVVHGRHLGGTASGGSARSRSGRP